MTSKDIIKDLKEKVCKEIELVSEGINRYKIFTPFSFDDGDQFVILLKNNNSKWYLTDEGHTMMHLSYDIDIKDFEKGTRQKLFSSILSSFSVVDKNGELIIQISENEFGNSLFSYIQALVKITDLLFLSRERVNSTFMDDFKSFIEESVPANRIKFDYIDKTHDPKGFYPVDCVINELERPIFLYGIQNESKAKDVTISILQFERWEIKCHPVAIFEDQENINRKVIARFSDVVEKQFSSLTANKERISKYIKEVSLQ